MTGTFRTLPLLLQMCSTIDQLFVEKVGPFGKMVIEETREVWLSSGNKMRSSDVNAYIVLLAKEIESASTRAEFVAAAIRIVGVSRPRPAR